MKDYEYVFFDLDGTLTDPALGITNSVIHALQKYGIHVAERGELFKFIGPPLWDSFEIFYGFSKEQANEAVGFYREFYNDKGIYENFVYEGMEDVLKELVAASKKLVVATSKPEVFAKRILDHFALTGYFEYVAGSNYDGTRIKKNEVIEYAISSCGITDLSKVIMIGDREHDIMGAKKVGVDSMGVLYGYGNRAEFEAAGADYIVETVGDIAANLLKFQTVRRNA